MTSPIHSQERVQQISRAGLAASTLLAGVFGFAVDVEIDHRRIYGTELAVELFFMQTECHGVGHAWVVATNQGRALQRIARSGRD